MIFGGYETFRLHNSLIGSIYPTSPQSHISESQDSERQAKLAMMRTVAKRGKYWYSYSEYLIVSLMKLCCCCMG